MEKALNTKSLGIDSIVRQNCGPALALDSYAGHWAVFSGSGGHYVAESGAALVALMNSVEAR